MNCEPPGGIKREPEERSCNVCQNVTRDIPLWFPSTGHRGCWAIICKYCGKKLIVETV